MKIQDLYDKLGKIHKQMEDALDEARSTGKMDPEKSKEYDQWEKEFDDTENLIKKLEKNQEREVSLSKEVEERIEKVEKKEGKIDDKELYRAAFEKYLRFQKLNEAEWNVLYRGATPEARAASQSTTTTAGGYTIPEDFANQIATYMAYYGPFGQPAPNSPFTDWVSSTGADMPYPTVNDTSNTGELLAEAGDATTNSTAITFGVVTFGSYKFSSNLLQVSRELLQDSYFNLQNYLAERLGERLGRIKNSYATTGTGSSQPKGVVTGATQGKVTSSAAAITQTELMDLMYAVDIAYHNGPKAGWMMHQNILSAIRKLDLSTSNYTQPVWQPSFAQGVPATLLGKPYWINNGMASSISTGGKTVLFGDFSKFIIRRVMGIDLLRLDERFAEKYQTGWVAFERWDSDVVDTTAIKYLEQT